MGRDMIGLHQPTVNEGNDATWGQRGDERFRQRHMDVEGMRGGEAVCIVWHTTDTDTATLD